MPRQRNPGRDKAFKIYKKHNGDIDLIAIAKKLKLPAGTIRGWKSKDKWDDKLNGTLQKNTERSNNKKKSEKQQVNNTEYDINEDAGLTEKQHLFCLYYIKNRNATQAAMKAGYSKESAHVQGCVLLKHPKVSKEIRRLKKLMATEVFLDAKDVLQKYVQIAFSDITECVEFGQREVQVMGAFGPVYRKVQNGDEEEEVPVMKTVNFIDIKSSNEVDGSLIQEVSQGKDGVKIKFLDKMKALEKLEKYVDLFGDMEFKHKIEEEKIKIAEQKLELEKKKHDDPDEQYEDDGFIEALEGSVKEVWEDES